MRPSFPIPVALRTAIVFTVAAVPALLSGHAMADDVQACLDSHEQSQMLRKDGRLRKAREHLLTCSRDICPGVIRQECGTWLGQVANVIPSVTLVARKDRKDLIDVKVSMDGEQLVTQLDGRAVDVDPGPHTFVFEAAGQKPVEMKVVIREGEKARELMAEFGAELAGAGGVGVGAGDGTPGADQGAARPIPTLTYVLGGVGVAALAGSAFFELRGMSKRSDLDSQGCKPYCDAEEVDAAKQSILIGDIALGVGLASLGTAAYFYFTRPAAPTTSAAPARRIDVLTFAGGAGAGVSGSF